MEDDKILLLNNEWFYEHLWTFMNIYEQPPLKDRR
jgi:hypothetical protein